MTGTARKPELLIISFSPIARDARILKQIALLGEGHRITTCGYGRAPDGVDAHVEVPAGTINRVNGKLAALRQFRRVYWSQQGPAWARDRLDGDWDVVLANDADTVLLAFEIAPAERVHVDLHEFFPALHAQNPIWRRFVAPYFRWLVRRHVRRAASVSTVSATIALEYRRLVGHEVLVVTNAAPYRADLEPTEVGVPIRLVHSGAALRNRDLGLLVEATQRARSDVTLDLYLAPNDPAYIEELRERGRTGGRVVVHDPVPYRDLADTLNDYDVGVHVLPPVNRNHELALPNKIFDYTQARLGLVVGPSVEMSDHVRSHGIGVVADGFTAAALAAAFDGLTVQMVRGFKANSHSIAEPVGAEAVVLPWLDAVEKILQAQGRRSGRARS
jgi:hypothetical protein